MLPGSYPERSSSFIVSQSGKSSSSGALVLGALGVVYGDIGTSPLYVLKTVFDGPTGLALDAQNLVAIISLIFWAWLWGVVGALLSVPILMSFKAICDRIPPLSPVSEFLGR